MSNKSIICCSCNQNMVFIQKYIFQNTGNFQSVLTDNNLYKCSSCGLQQANHFSINKDKLDIFYKLNYSENKQLKYDSNKIVKGTNAYKKNIVRGRVITNIVSNYLHNDINKQYDFFEFGAGYGFTLLELKKRFNNANLFAEEPSDILDDSIS